MSTDDRLQALVLAMVRKNGHSKPKLRCSAAVCRKHVPFVATELSMWWSDDAVDEAIKVATQHLHNCYMSLSEGSTFQSDVLLTTTARFAAQLVALETVDPSGWGVKTMLHLFGAVFLKSAPTSLLELQR